MFDINLNKNIQLQPDTIPKPQTLMENLYLKESLARISDVNPFEEPLKILKNDSIQKIHKKVGKFIADVEEYQQDYAPHISEKQYINWIKTQQINPNSKIGKLVSHKKVQTKADLFKILLDTYSNGEFPIEPTVAELSTYQYHSFKPPSHKTLDQIFTELHWKLKYLSTLMALAVKYSNNPKAQTSKNNKIKIGIFKKIYEQIHKNLQESKKEPWSILAVQPPPQHLFKYKANKPALFYELLLHHTLEEIAQQLHHQTHPNNIILEEIQQQHEDQKLHTLIHDPQQYQLDQQQLLYFNKYNNRSNNYQRRRYYNKNKSYRNRNNRRTSYYRPSTSSRSNNKSNRSNNPQPSRPNNRSNNNNNNNSQQPSSTNKYNHYPNGPRQCRFGYYECNNIECPFSHMCKYSKHCKYFQTCQYHHQQHKSRIQLRREQKQSKQQPQPQQQHHQNQNNQQNQHNQQQQQHQQPSGQQQQNTQQQQHQQQRYPTPPYSN